MGNADPFLNAAADLFGPANQVASAGSVLPDHPPSVPENWQSKAAQHLSDRQQRLTAAATDISDTDDRISARLAQADSTVRDGKSQIARVQEQYRIASARLSSVPQTPELAARQAILDHNSMQQAYTTVTDTISRLPTLDPYAPTSFGHGPIPTSSVVWCRPHASGGFMCRELLANGTIAIFPSPTDVSGGWP